MDSAAPTLPAVDISTMRRGPTLTLEQQTTLCTEVTDQEIIDSLGCTDKAGPVMHNDVLLAVKDFLHTGKII